MGSEMKRFARKPRTGFFGAKRASLARGWLANGRARTFPRLRGAQLRSSNAKGPP